jgi:hypothetical protein
MQETAHPVPATMAAEAPRGERSFARMAGVLAIVSLPLSVGNVLAMLATVHFDVRGMTDPLVLLHASAAAGGLWRTSMVLDIAGYYLAIVPLVVVLRSWLRPPAPGGSTSGRGACSRTASWAPSAVPSWQRLFPP